MLWIKEHRRIWRTAFLIILAVAMVGPWFFDRIFVPQPYTCSFPNVRLDDMFCGIPTSITWFYTGILAQFSYLVNGLITGSSNLANADRQWEWLFMLLIILLLLPFLTTAILILRKDSWGWLLIHRIGLVLVAGMGGFIGMPGVSRASWMLWGLWLYTGSTISMWILEFLMARIPRERVQE